jgi:AcrR family transcriptional regulator
MVEPAAEAPVSGQAARWAGQRERRREQFVDAALATIAAEGPGATVEQIAARAGVARTRIYRHFTDLADLENAISARVGALIVAELDPAWRIQGSARQIISGIIGAHAGWLVANADLYRYLLAHPGGDDGLFGVRRTVAGHLTGLIRGYFGIVGVPAQTSEAMAFGLVGLVESVTTRWLEAPGELDGAGMTDLLTGWVWAMFDATLRGVGVELDPDVPLPALMFPG